MNTKPSNDNFEDDDEKGDASEAARAARRRAHRFGRSLGEALRILGPTAARIAVDLITEHLSDGEGH